MTSEKIFELIAAWGDLVSLVLVTVSLYVGGLTPSRSVWGRSPIQNAHLFGVHTLSIAYSAFRFIGEGIFLTTGPREFLAGNVVYTGRWLWLSWRMNRPSYTEGRLFQVARALKELKTIRIGPSTEKTSKDKQEGEWELVIRRGARKAPNGQKYWRGVKERPDVFHGNVSTWEVRLVEERMHSDKLDIFGTVEYMNLDQASKQTAYKKIYEVVMLALPRRPVRSGSREYKSIPGHGLISLPSKSEDRLKKNGTIDVDFRPFLDIWEGVPSDDWMPASVGANDERPIGWVARKVAADAIEYANKTKESNILEQIKVINECLEDTVKGFFQQHSDTAETAVDLESYKEY